MYSKELIYRDAKQIINDSKGMISYVVIAQPRRDLDETPAQKLDGLVIHIDTTGYSRGFINIGGEKTDVARNYLMEACVDSGAKYMLFVGEDTVMPHDGFLRLHDTCEQNPGSIAIGVYYMKGSSPMIMVNDGKWIGVANVDPGQKPFKVACAGMDAMLIPISILQRMKEEEPENPFCCILNDVQIDKDTHVDFIGEDNYFYNRCHQMNIPILCNTDVQCLHMDLATGKYTAHPSVDLDNYITTIPITERITFKDRKYIENRWTSRLPTGSNGIPSPTQVKEEFEQLLNYAKDKKLVLEIGTNMGGSLYSFIHTVSPQAEIISIDMPYGYGGSPNQPTEKVLQSWKLPEQTLHVIRDDSHAKSTVEKVKEILNGRKFDFVFIDGDHTYEGVKADYDLYHEYSQLMAFHDIVKHPQASVNVKRFWDELEGNKIEIIHDPDQGWAGIGLTFLDDMKESILER